MKPLEAHLKLLSILPVRTHQARAFDPPPHRSTKRTILMRGKVYKGFRQCAMDLRVAYKTIYKEATFLDQLPKERQPIQDY